MKVTKTLGLLCVLILVMLTVQSAYGANILPASTYGLENKWSGFKDYNKDNFDVRVYFNVYAVADGEFTWPGGESEIEDDDYIYVYEIENRGDQSNNNIGAFSLLYADGSSIAQHLMHNTTSHDYGIGGIAPDSEGATNQGEWVWSSDTGYIEADQHSWVLMFSSDHAPTRGKFELQSESDFPAPEEEEVPEPASIILFGSAFAWLIARRNNKRQSS